ncbi:MAG: cell envelope integrity protein TolA [Gammaproteobacteria bacterium]
MEQLKKFLNFIVNLFTGLIVAGVEPIVRIARKHPIAFFFAMIIHIALVVGLFYTNVQRWEMPDQTAGAQQSAPTKAVTIDVEVIKAERQRLVNIEQERQDKSKREKEQTAAAIKAQDHAEIHQKTAEAEALDAEKQKQLADEERKITEAKSVEASKKKVLAEAKAAEAAEQTVLEEEKAREAEKEAEIAAEKRVLEEEKARAAEEQKTLAEEKAREAEEAAKIANEDRLKEEAKAEEAKQRAEKFVQMRKAAQDAFEEEQKRRDLIKELQDEEDLDRRFEIENQINQLKSSYINRIAARVREFWRYQGAEDDWSCEVHIGQDEDGYIDFVRVLDCTIDDSSKAQSFRNSVERAVRKAEPLPIAPDSEVFDKEILIIFRVN